MKKRFLNTAVVEKMNQHIEIVEPESLILKVLKEQNLRKL